MSARREGHTPVACPACGWTADGRLEVVDRYVTDWPPIPPCDLREVRQDDDPEGLVHECEACGEWLEPDTVKPTEEPS